MVLTEDGMERSRRRTEKEVLAQLISSRTIPLERLKLYSFRKSNCCSYWELIQLSQKARYKGGELHLPWPDSSHLSTLSNICHRHQCFLLPLPPALHFNNIFSPQIQHQHRCFLSEQTSINFFKFLLHGWPLPPTPLHSGLILPSPKPTDIFISSNKVLTQNLLFSRQNLESMSL